MPDTPDDLRPLVADVERAWSQACAAVSNIASPLHRLLQAVRTNAPPPVGLTPQPPTSEGDAEPIDQPARARASAWAALGVKPSVGEESGHGHVCPRSDGWRARCGGPGLCLQCATDQLAMLLGRKYGLTRVEVVDERALRDLAAMDAHPHAPRRAFGPRLVDVERIGGTDLRTGDKLTPEETVKRLRENILAEMIEENRRLIAAGEREPTSWAQVLQGLEIVGSAAHNLSGDATAMMEYRQRVEDFSSISRRISALLVGTSPDLVHTSDDAAVILADFCARWRIDEASLTQAAWLLKMQPQGRAN